MQKYSDGLDAVHAITGDAARNHAVLWSYENYSASFTGSDYYLVHRFRYLVYRGDGELVDPSGVYATQTLTGDGNNYIALDLEDIAWLTPGRLYQVKDCIFCLESDATSGTSATVSGASGGTTIIIGGGGSGSGMEVHALDPGTWHTGTLSWANVSKTGSSLADLATRLHSDLGGVTANQHHNQQHVLATETGLGADHTMSGATAGHVLRASGASAAAFAQLQHNDLGGVTSDQHHARQHNIVAAADHTITGAAFQVVGATATDTLGLLTPSYAPGAAAAILRTNSDGSLTLVDGLLAVDGTQRNVWINSGTPDGSAAFKAKAYANDDITVLVQKKTGQTGRLWKITDDTGQELVVITNNGYLQSGNPGFVSGLTGWQIAPEGTAEFNNVWVRGELHSSIFVMDEFHATGGTLFVGTAAALEADAVINSTSVTTFDFEIEPGGVGLVDLQIEPDGGGAVTLQGETIIIWLDISDPESGHAQLFGVGDILRCKTFNGTAVYDLWLTVVSVADQTTYYRYYVTKNSGTDTTLPAGSAVISYGQSGDGRILLTADQNYAPYMDVFTTGANPWAGGLTPHVRVGRLDGVGVDGVSGVEQYGLIAGTDLSDNDAPYIVASNLQLKLYKVNLESYNGVNQTVSLGADGTFKLGTGVGNPNTTGLSFDPATGNLTIGNAGYPGTVTVRGSITVTGGDAATQTYANNAAATAQSNAEDYADTVAGNAQTGAQDYANARRIVAVTGLTHTGGAPIKVTVSGGSIRLGSGATKTLADGEIIPGGNGVWFLYVNVTAAAPLTVGYTSNLADLGADHGVIAVFTVSSGTSSLLLTPGNTYIGPAGIIANAILSGHIAAGQINAGHISSNAITTAKLNAAAVTADKIAANSITAEKIQAGVITADKLATVGSGITIGNNGSVASSGKTYGGATAGFFLGYDVAAYKFDIGDANNYLRWTGSALQLRTRSPLVLETTSDASHAIQFINSQGQTAELKFNYQQGVDFNCFVFNRDVSGGGTVDLVGWAGVQAAAFTNTAGGLATLGATSIDSLTFDGNPATEISNIVTAWVGLTPRTGWSNGNTSLAYAKMGEVVILRGTLTRTNNNQTVIATLPVGVRPATVIEAPTYIVGSGSPHYGGYVTIETDGDIVLGDSGTYANQTISLLIINAVFTTRA